MKRLTPVVLPLCAGLLAPATALAGDSLVSAIADGKTTLNLRLRHEQVDDDKFDKTAQASTLRARLGYLSKDWHGIGFGVELDHVQHLGGQRFNDTRNKEVEFPMVVDPDGTDLNQAFVTYKVAKSTLTAGRQRLNLGNQRWVGGVAWRQNEQTFDALRLQSKAIDTVDIDYAYVGKTRRVFGPQDGVPPADLDSDHHLVTVNWQPLKAVTLGSYAYLLDFDEMPEMSSRTVGALATGAVALKPVTLDYRVEAARQDDYGDNAKDFEASYHHVVLGAKVAGVRAFVAEERLGADKDAGVALQTPLATLHAFQGWADKLMTTPKSGLRDRYVGASTTLKGTALTAVWHDYEADAGSAELGSEWNLQASHTFAKRYTLTAKYADYRAETFAKDTQKVWLMAEATF